MQRLTILLAFCAFMARPAFGESGESKELDLGKKEERNYLREEPEEPMCDMMNPRMHHFIVSESMPMDYYLCLRSGSGWATFQFHCPEKSVFDLALESCVPVPPEAGSFNRLQYHNAKRPYVIFGTKIRPQTHRFPIKSPNRRVMNSKIATQNLFAPTPEHSKLLSNSDEEYYDEPSVNGQED